MQPVTLGVDAGAKVIGLSASTDKAELYASEVKLRTDVIDLLSARRELRRARRSRKTRHRALRFDNRVERLSAAVSCKKLMLLEKRKTFLTQLIKESAIPPATKVAGFLA